MPLLVMLIFWLTLLFASFGLFVRANPMVVVSLFASALAVCGAIYLILEMYQPYSGLIQASSVPLRTALEQLGQWRLRSRETGFLFQDSILVRWLAGMTQTKPSPETRLVHRASPARALILRQPTRPLPGSSALNGSFRIIRIAPRPFCHHSGDV